MKIKTTIEVFGIEIKNIDGFINFGTDPDIFKLLADKTTGFISHIDHNNTGDVPTLKRTVRIPANETNDKGEVLKYYHANENERYICGIIETGAYGKVYEIANKDTPQNVTYIIEKEQAIIKPFFFFIKIPRTGTKALLILERTDNEGIYPLMHILLKTFLDNKFGVEKLFNIQKSNIILNAYMKELSEGRYKSLILKANQLPEDKSDRYMGGLSSSDYTIELIVKFKNRLGVDKEKTIRKLVNSGESLFDIPELDGIFDTNNRKVVTQIGTGKNAKTRTYYLNNEQKELIRPYYDIEVDCNKKNFSDYQSIKTEVRNFVNGHNEFNIFR